MDRCEARLAAAEAHKVDLTPLEAAIAAAKREVASVGEKTVQLLADAQETSSKLKGVSARVDDMTSMSSKEKTRLSALYDILEMNEATVLALVADLLMLAEMENL